MLGMLDQLDDIDFVLAAFREGGAWRLLDIATNEAESIESLTHALRQISGDSGAIGMVGVDEDFFVLVRVDGASTRVLLSDVSAAVEWALAQSAIEHLGLPAHEEEDAEVPAGDLGILGDLGLSAAELGALLDEDDLYPDEALSEIADRLGFGNLFDDAVGLTSA